MTTNKDFKKVNICVNGCGKFVSWDPVLTIYVEAGTGQQHKCPKDKSKVHSHANMILTQTETVAYLDTLGPLVAENTRILEDLIVSDCEIKKNLDQLKVQIELKFVQIKDRLHELEGFLRHSR